MGGPYRFRVWGLGFRVWGLGLTNIPALMVELGSAGSLSVVSQAHTSCGVFSKLRISMVAFRI